MVSQIVKQTLWQVLGLLFYLGGMLLFLVVAIGIYLGPPEGSLENASAAHGLYFLVSLLLIVTGGYLSRRYGHGRMLHVGPTGILPGHAGFDDHNRHPDETRLEQLGYVLPPEESETPYVYEDGVVYVRCTECGTKNEQGYDFCEQCSAKLPEPDT